MADQTKITEWKSAAWFKSKFPLNPGKGAYNPPHRLLQNLISDAERTAEVLRWRDLTTKEQLAEKERLGYKVGKISNPGDTVEEAVQEQRAVAGEEDLQEPSPILVGLMDTFEARQAYAEKIESEFKKRTTRHVGTHPESVAQIKDQAATRKREELVKKLFQYIAMTTLPENMKDCPKLRVALIILDGLKPNLARGGRHKEGNERRERPLLSICTGSENDCVEILSAIDMRAFSDDFDPTLLKNDHCSVYSDMDAVCDSPLVVTADPIPLQTVLPHKDDNVPKEHWDEQEWILQKYPIQKGYGDRPVPLERIEQLSSSRAREKYVREWRRLRQRQQLAIEETLKDTKKIVDVIGNPAQKIPLQQEISLQENIFPVKTKTRIVGSPPQTIAQIKDSVTRKVFENLIKLMFTYITMTTPLALDKKGKSTTKWPRLKICLIILDELKPHNSSGGSGKQGRWRRAKPLIKIVAASKGDRDEVLHAVQDGILSQNKVLMESYDTIYAYNVNEGVSADFYGYAADRTRPMKKVLSVFDVISSINHLQVDDEVFELFAARELKEDISTNSSSIVRKEPLSLSSTLLLPLVPDAQSNCRTHTAKAFSSENLHWTQLPANNGRLQHSYLNLEQPETEILESMLERGELFSTSVVHWFFGVIASQNEHIVFVPFVFEMIESAKGWDCFAQTYKRRHIKRFIAACNNQNLVIVIPICRDCHWTCIVRLHDGQCWCVYYLDSYRSGKSNRKAFFQKLLQGSPFEQVIDTLDPRNNVKWVDLPHFQQQELECGAFACINGAVLSLHGANSLCLVQQSLENNGEIGAKLREIVVNTCKTNTWETPVMLAT